MASSSEDVLPPSLPVPVPVPLRALRDDPAVPARAGDSLPLSSSLSAEAAVLALSALAALPVLAALLLLRLRAVEGASPPAAGLNCTRRVPSPLA
jgi:hypothetical protein